MSWVSCPICENKNPPRTMRCSTCGADFDDPDVKAMVGSGVEMRAASVGETGDLSSAKFLGLSLDSLIEGANIGKLAVIGAVVAGLGFLVPIGIDTSPVWDIFDDGPKFALMFPAFAVLMGVGVALARNLAPWIRAAALSLTGMVGLASCLPGLGQFAGSNERIMPVLIVGLVLAGTALIIRVYKPQNRDARFVLAAGAALVVVGMLIPISDAWNMLPSELQFYVNEQELGSASLFFAVIEGYNRDPMIFFLSLFLLAPIVFIPIATAIAWAVPNGPWDKAGLILRVMAWITVLYLPLFFLLAMFNVMGWSASGMVMLDGVLTYFDDFTKTLMIGRFKLAVLASVFTLWAHLGAVVLFAKVRGIKQVESQA